MNDILRILIFALYWIIVPLIMFSLLVFGAIIAVKVKDKKKKISAIAGWWAGLVLFVFFFIFHISIIRIPSITMGTTIALSIPAGIVGAVIGLLTLWVLKPLIKKRVVGFLTLILSFSGSVSLLSYFFIGNVNPYLFSGILGLAFGSLLHFVIFPENAQDIF
jgi:hypothetical protein